MHAPHHAHLPSRRRALQILSMAGLCATAEAGAQNFPSRSVHMVVPQPAGGAADRLARILAERLEARWKRSIVVENKSGGGVVVGSTAVARATADGHTLGLLGASLSINAVQRKDLPYDALKDFTPLARIGYYTMALVAEKSLPANNVAELLTLARSQPGKLAFGSNGIGTSAQLAGEMLNSMAAVDMLHVPYNGAAKLYTDMVGGLVPLGFTVASSAEAFIKSGQLKVLGVTSAKRSPLYPDWPAISETLPGYEVVNWAGFCGPAGLSPAIAQKLSSDIVDVLKEEQVARLLAEMGIEVLPQAPEEFRGFIREEIQRFARITRPLAARQPS